MYKSQHFTVLDEVKTALNSIWVALKRSYCLIAKWKRILSIHIVSLYIYIFEMPNTLRDGQGKGWENSRRHYVLIIATNLNSLHIDTGVKKLIDKIDCWLEGTE